MMNAAEKINAQQQAQELTTKEQIEKVLKLKGMFYAKTKNFYLFIFSIIYNDGII